MRPSSICATNSPVGERRGEQNAVARLPWMLSCKRVETLSQLAQQQREIAFVLAAMHEAGAGQSRIFPIEIDAVDTRRRDQLDGALRESRTRRRIGRGVGETFRAPAADRNEYCKLRIARLERAQTREIMRGRRHVERDPASGVDMRERVVDCRKFLRVDARQHLCGGDVAHESVAWRGPRMCLGPARRREKREDADAEEESLIQHCGPRSMRGPHCVSFPWPPVNGRSSS